jgi:hypothetical protein
MLVLPSMAEYIEFIRHGQEPFATVLTPGEKLHDLSCTIPMRIIPELDTINIPKVLRNNDKEYSFEVPMNLIPNLCKHPEAQKPPTPSTARR